MTHGRIRLAGLRLLVTTTTILSAGACSWVGFGKPRPAFPQPASTMPGYATPGRLHADSARIPDVARKTVASLEAPATLFAEDGTRCTVNAKRFADIRVGDRAFCAWRSLDR